MFSQCLHHFSYVSQSYKVGIIILIHTDKERSPAAKWPVKFTLLANDRIGTRIEFWFPDPCSMESRKQLKVTLRFFLTWRVPQDYLQMYLVFSLPPKVLTLLYFSRLITSNHEVTQIRKVGVNLSLSFIPYTISNLTDFAYLPLLKSLPLSHKVFPKLPFWFRVLQQISYDIS